MLGVGPGEPPRMSRWCKYSLCIMRMCVCKINKKKKKEKKKNTAYICINIYIDKV